MEPIYYVMAILGCADDGAGCAPVRQAPARYQSLAACEAAMPRMLQGNADLEYPVIGARCAAHGVRIAQRATRGDRSPS